MPRTKTVPPSAACRGPLHGAAATQGPPPRGLAAWELKVSVTPPPESPSPQAWSPECLGGGGDPEPGGGRGLAHMGGGETAEPEPGWHPDANVSLSGRSPGSRRLQLPPCDLGDAASGTGARELTLHRGRPGHRGTRAELWSQGREHCTFSMK